MGDWVTEKLFGSETNVDPELPAYLNEISKLGVDRLVKEPERLAAERTSVKEETESLAFANYKTFIQAANCSKQIFDDFTLIEQHLDNVVEQLPALNVDCNEFARDATDIMRTRQLNAQALNKHSQLLEILEIPQVMDTCVRAGYWEEALELSSYVHKLQRRLSHIPVVQDIAKEIQNLQQVLLEQLLDQLNTQLTLPQCLKVVGFLRRLNAFTETELRIKFLDARDKWLSSILSTIPTDDSHQHASKCMEQLRVHLFDICTQYRAVFTDDDPMLSTSTSGSTHRYRDALPTNLSAIYHSWMLHKVDQIIQILDADVRSQGGAGRLDSLLSQAMYFGASFGRVGADFRSLIIPVFTRAAGEQIMTALNTAAHRLQSELSHIRCIDQVRHTQHVSSSTVTTDSTTTTPTSLQPPMCLLEWPTLAVYCNQILTAINNTRACLPLGLAAQLAPQLQSHLLAVTERMAELKSELGPTAGSRADKWDRACYLITIELVPFLNRCLEFVFPTQQLLTQLGLNYANVQVIKFCRLDVDAIAAPVSSDDVEPASELEPIFSTPVLDLEPPAAVVEPKLSGSDIPELHSDQLDTTTTTNTTSDKINTTTTTNTTASGSYESMPHDTNSNAQQQSSAESVTVIEQKTESISLED